jgi:hypothetical protein
VWRGLGEYFFLQSEVGVQVDLRGFDGFMAEPQRNYCGVDPGLQQFHGSGVPQNVRCNVLALQRLQAWQAMAVCLARIYCIPSALRCPPRALGNRISLLPLVGSSNQDLKPAHCLSLSYLLAITNLEARKLAQKGGCGLPTQ